MGVVYIGTRRRAVRANRDVEQIETEAARQREHEKRRRFQVFAGSRWGRPSFFVVGPFFHLCRALVFTLAGVDRSRII